MKQRFLFFILSTILTVNCFGQTKHALIFAIGNYPQKNGWATISSVKDVNYIKTALARQGFDDIRIVQDAAATSRGIANAMRDLVNDKAVKAGDVVVIHFSAHGEQVQDDNGDETDGLDESIVGYNALLPRLSKDFEKDQVEYFRDDEFGKYIDQLREKLGKDGDIVVFMDACHSGSGTRGSEKVRGGQPPFVSKNFDPAKYSNGDTSGVFREKNATRGDENSLATYVVFSAAKAQELDHEANGMGSLTYAISKVLEDPEAGTTYRSLFAKIQSIMNEVVPAQHPVLEGNGIDRQLFGGKFVQQKPYVEIDNINGTKIFLKSGLMAGLDSGARIAVYPAGTTDPANAKLIASGVITQTANYSSMAILDKDPGIKQPASAWVFVTEPVYKTSPITIAFRQTRSAAVSFSQNEQEAIKSNLKDLPLINFTGKPELIVAKGATEDSVFIASNGYLFSKVKDIKNNPGEFKKLLEYYSQYKFLGGLEVNDPTIKVEVRLVPVINGVADTSKADANLVHGVYEFKEGEKLAIWVKNKGFSQVYINILDMQPDGIINPVFPNRRKNIYKEDLVVDRRSDRVFAEYPINILPPDGTEIFKIFVSRQEIDMQEIADSHGTISRGNFTMLEKLVKKSYDVASRGTDTDNLSNTSGSTFNVVFLIKSKGP